MDQSVSKREINRQRWLERISAWKKSNQSQREFCKAHHLGYASFRRWRSLLREEEAGNEVRLPSEPIRLLPVQLHQAKPIAANLTIVVEDNLRIEVPAQFDSHLLRQVIKVLRAS